MKKLIALVAVVTMLFGIVGTASAYDVSMQIFVNPDLVQWGPSDYRAADMDDATVTGLSYNWSTGLTMNVVGKYADLTKWYNYSNSNEQAAWVRIPIILDSVDAANFPNINTKSTQWNDSGKLIQAGSYITINGVMYPVGVIKGRDTAITTVDGTRYHPFFRDVEDTAAGPAAYDTKTTGDDYIVATGSSNLTNPTYPALVDTDLTVADAIGVYYSVKLIAGGCSEKLDISYSPNGVEVYKSTINVNYSDIGSTNNATVAREIGSNAAYFNAKFSGGDTMAFDTVLKSGNMIHSNVEYKYIDATGGTIKTHANYDGGATGEEYKKFPTIVMEAKVKLLDVNGNALPVRTQIKGTSSGNAINRSLDATAAGFKSSMSFFIGKGAPAATTNVYLAADDMLFSNNVAYGKTFDAATTTDDGVYGELDANGEFTVRVRIIDNGSAIVNDALATFMNGALATVNTITPYFNTLENITLTGEATLTNVYTIEGVKNRVNYNYLSDVKQNVYTYNAMAMQYLDYDLKLNSMDRIDTITFAISGNTSDNLPVGSTRQLQPTYANGSAVTDRTVIWTSSNTSVATVNSAGLVTAVSSGTTYITARFSESSGYDTVAVTVGEIPVATVAPVTPTTTQYFVAVGSSSSLNVRSGANTKSARVGRLKRGDTVNVYEIVDGWAKIDYNGSIAYVSSRYISQ